MTTSISSLSSQIASSLLSKIDTKNQGYIDKAEFSATGDSNNTNSDDAFSALDSDSDGKVTKSELTKGIENLLSSLSSSSVKGQEHGNRPPPPDGPPPSGSNDGGDDTGITKEQMSKMASETKDSKLSSMLKDVSSNFDAADTNKDGKVSREEAMAYEQSKGESSSSSNSTTSGTSSSSDAAMKKIAELLAKYASESSTSATSTSSSNVSVSA